MSRRNAPLPPLTAAGQSDEAVFRRLAKVKFCPPAAPMQTLGAELIDFFKKDVERRQNRFGNIAEIWAQLIPETLLEHTCLESFHAGTLKVLVDSSSHLYELKTVLLAGLQKQILLAGRGAGLRKIALKPGRWYEGDDPQQRRVTFQ